MKQTAVTPAKRTKQPTPSQPAKPARFMLRCPALIPDDPTGAMEEVDAFLDRIKPYAAQLAFNTLAEVARDTNRKNAAINGSRARGALGLMRAAGLLVDRVQVQPPSANGPLSAIPTATLEAEWYKIEEAKSAQ